MVFSFRRRDTFEHLPDRMFFSELLPLCYPVFDVPITSLNHTDSPGACGGVAIWELFDQPQDPIDLPATLLNCWLLVATLCPIRYEGDSQH